MRKPSIVNRAYLFAKTAHGAIDHRRKYTNAPYITHPMAVADLVASVEHTQEMLAAAMLHDTVEDTPTTLEDIRREFGDEVASLVGWLTDVSQPQDGNRRVRKALDRAHIAAAPAAAKTIKLADLIENAASIVAHDPGFARTYLPEMALLLEVLTEGDPTLWNQAARAVREGMDSLSIAPTAILPEWAQYVRPTGICPGEEVVLVRGRRGRGPESGPGFERCVRARYLGGDEFNILCELLEDDPHASTAPFSAGERGVWHGESFLRKPDCGGDGR